MDRTRMLVDVASQKFIFGFSPNCSGTFSLENLDVGDEVYLQHLCEEALKMALVSEVWPSDVSSSSLVAQFPAFFSSTLGMANCAPYEIELPDPPLL
jgi:hypothetical protein